MTDGDGAPARAPSALSGPEGRRSLMRWGIGVGLGLLVLVGAFFVARGYVDSQWYVGVANEHVAVYRGIPAAPLGFHLSHVEEQTDLLAADVQKLELYAGLSDGINAESREDAQAVVDQMRKDLQASQPQKGVGRSVSAAAIEAAKPPRAKTGLALLILALVVSVGAFVVAGLGLEGKVPPQTAVYGVLYTAAFLGAWAVVRWSARGADPVLLPVAAILGGLGIAMLYRIMVDRGQPEIWIQQAVWLFVGLAAFVLTLLLVRDDRRLDAYTYTIGLAGVILLLLPVVPGIGYEINGARLWARIGPLSFQPAEFGKILIVIFLASYLASKRELLASGVGRLGMPRGKDLGPLLLAWGASLAVLFLERDMGASLLFFGVFVVMLWIASGRFGYLVIGGLLFVLGAYIGYLAFSHVQLRVDYWLHALDPAKVLGLGYYQLAQGWFALASGGLVGHRHRSGLAHADPVRGERLHLRGLRRGAGDAGGRRAAAPLPRPDRTGAADRDGAHRRVREVAGHRAHDRARAADVRDRGRRHPVDPAHRRAAAARVLRRLEPRGHLHHPGAVGAPLRRTVGARAWIGVSGGWASPW